MGIGVSVVVGGGNIVRGRSCMGIDREDADSMGMLATTINGIALHAYLTKIGIDSVLMSNLQLPFGIENSNFRQIQQNIIYGKTLIFVGGAGQPYFSTDTISVINAITTRADIMLKATKTDGIYDKDPKQFEDAKHIPELTHKKALELGVKIMDQTAFAIAMENNIPIMVFSISENNCFVRAIQGDIKHSIVKS